MTMVQMKKKSFRAYLDSFQDISARATSWPTSVFDDEVRKDISEFPCKYVNWLVWILQTAPAPKTEQDEKSRTFIKNTLAEILEVDGGCDYLEDLRW